jgi:hypothetical protein
MKILISGDMEDNFCGDEAMSSTPRHYRDR